MLYKSLKDRNSKLSLIKANSNYEGKPATMVAAPILEGKKRGNLIFTGNGIRLRKNKNEVSSS